MVKPPNRHVLIASVLGAALAVALELLWPGAWHRGSTPRFLATVVLVLLTLVVLVR